MKKIILVDGSSVIFRAYYALPKFTTSNGIPTSAVYGFLRMLLRILKDEKPEYIAVAFDKKAPTFRHIEYKEYKSQRPKMPDELSVQFDIVKEILDAIGIRYYELEGFEADDIIATFVEKLKKFELEILILSSDFDLAQLIQKNVKLLITRKGVTKIEVYDEERFVKEFGFEPTHLVDYKALLGDVSDNIEGVKGIGEKTASKLISEFKNVEDILKNEEVALKFRLKDEEEKILKNKSLCMLVKDVPVKFEIDDLKVPDFKTENTHKALKKYEFNSISKEFGFKEGDLVNDSLFGNANKEELKSTNLKIEDRGDSAEKAVLYVSSNEKRLENVILVYNESIYEFDFENKLFLDHRHLPILKDVLLNANLEKYTNNLKMLYKVADYIGVPLNNVLLDSSLALYLIDPDGEDFSIKNFKRYLNAEIEIANLHDELNFLKNYGHHILEYLKKEGLEFVFRNIELPLAKVLYNMEKLGIAIDVEYFERLNDEIDARIQELEQKIYKLAGISFNILSSKQLSSVLYEVLGIEFPKGYSGGTGSSILTEISNSHPIIPLIIEYRHLVKLKNTYIEPIPHLVSKETGRLHTIYHQIGTSTGRLRSTNPNLQNLPVKDEWGNKIQRGFIAQGENNVLVSADYSQIELRILAHLSKDKNLIESFLNKEDIHKRTAMEIFNLKESEVTKEKRNLAKAINFGIIYGISPYGLSKQIGISKDEAKEYIERYFNRYPMVREYIEKEIVLAKEKGETRTIFGRRRFIHGLDDKNGVIRESAKRIAINSPIQGSAADIIKLAMVEIENKIKDIRILLQIHDELVFEIKRDALIEKLPLIKNTMENICKLSVPLEVDISYGRNLGEART
ncbi:DNA polymerase I [Caldisericum exile]|uniref:DNA polymerase I n=1 Tax=Caldisericum exile (strain DSM 21853 / NBRC 104410 / AZM16c01) TaxID=511051 RepID=A0A7U6GEW5_CALEA|nr:DNA polymerase I [Caldisericum exile]BAL81042.1 DNA polymerase I [Caldisericum exile AZM16c01]